MHQRQWPSQWTKNNISFVFFSRKVVRLTTSLTIIRLETIHLFGFARLAAQEEDPEIVEKLSGGQTFSNALRPLTVILFLHSWYKP